VYLQHPNTKFKTVFNACFFNVKERIFLSVCNRNKMLRPNDFQYHSDGRCMDTVSLRAVLVQSYSSSRWTGWRDCKSSLFRL